MPTQPAFQSPLATEPERNWKSNENNIWIHEEIPKIHDELPKPPVPTLCDKASQRFSPQKRKNLRTPENNN